MPIFTKDKKNYLFIHIPKTAGTTIEKSFAHANYKTSYRRSVGNPLNKVTCCTPQHIHADIINQTFNIQKFDGIFTMVRNPYDRVRSEYAMRHKDKSKIDGEDVYLWLKEKINAYWKDKYINDNHIRPQAEFIVQGTDIFKLEDGIDYFFESLKQKYQINTSSKTNHMSSQKRNGFSSSEVMLNDDSVDLINNFYNIDFKLFNYKMD